MTHIFKQSTAVTVRLGPALAVADLSAVTDLAKTDLTISKAGGAPAALNAAASLATHEGNGYYLLTLAAADVDTLKGVEILGNKTGMIPLHLIGEVLPANVFDARYGDDLLHVDRVQVGGAANTAAPATHSAADVRDLLVVVADSFKADVSALATAAALSAVASNVSEILTDTGTTLPATLVEIVGYIDTEIAAIKAVTDNLPDSGALSDLGTLVTRLTSARALLLDNLSNLDAAITTRLASGNVTVGDIGTAALAKLVTTDTGETTAAAGSVAKIAQGEAGSLTAEAVRTEMDANSTKLANLDVAVSTRAESVGAGSGAYTITVTIDDGTDPLENATVRFVEGVTAKVLTTDAAGQVEMPADAATWSVRVTKPGYNGLVTTLAVGADAAVTYSLSAVALAAPADPTEATVVADTRSLLGVVVEGLVIHFELSGGATAWGETILDRTAKTMTTDAAGRATESLPRTDAMTPSGRQWLVTCQELGWNQKPFALASATLNLATLIS